MVQLSNWIPGWTVDKNLQIWGTLRYLILTGAQAIAWQPRFFCPPCKCLSRISHSRGTKPLPDEIDTSSGWQTVRISWVSPASIVRLQRDYLRHHQCRSGYHPGTQWQRCQAFPQEFCWCILRSLLVHLLDQKTSLGTWNDRIESWTRSSTCFLYGFSFDDMYW